METPAPRSAIRPAVASSRRPSRPRAWLVPLACLPFLAACGRSGPEAPAGGMFGGPVPVAVVEARAETLPLVLEYPAQLLGAREVEVRARVTGILQHRNYAEGGKVRAGQSLFTVDPAPFAAAVERAEAELAAAVAREQQAAREAARLKPLVEGEAASRKEYDDALSAQAIAAADLLAARARLREARLNLEWTRVESPISGVAGRALKSEGSLVSGPDVLLTTVTQTDPMQVLFGIPDSERLRLVQEVQAGRLALPADGRFQVTLRLADGSEYRHAGKTDFTDVRVSRDTGTSEARAEVPNPAGLLQAGQFVRVRLAGARREGAFRVPQRAVLEGPQGKFVYVVAPGDAAQGGGERAEMRPVETGEWIDGDVVVIRGLASGERVIVDGVLKLGPGAPVQASPLAAPAKAE